jgi:1-acylglycerone phosphate reductase
LSCESDDWHEMVQKTVLITGCSPGGIGDGLARELQGRGWLVFATARNTAKLADLRALGMEALELDVTSDASIEKMVAELAAHPPIAGHGLDLVINCAGIDMLMPFADFTLPGLRRSIDTNLYGTLAVTNVLLPHVVRAHGTVVLVGSITPHMPGMPFQSLYVATKAGIEAASHTLRVELAPLGVKVMLLVPGCIKTHIFEDHVGGKGDGKVQDGIAMPEGSWYAPIRNIVEGRVFTKGVTWAPVAPFAKKVADQLAKAKPPLQLWLGPLSGIVWWIKGWLWVGSLVCLFNFLARTHFYRIASMILRTDKHEQDRMWKRGMKLGKLTEPAIEAARLERLERI